MGHCKFPFSCLQCKSWVCLKKTILVPFYYVYRVQCTCSILVQCTFNYSRICTTLCTCMFKEDLGTILVPYSHDYIVQCSCSFICTGYMMYVQSRPWDHSRCYYARPAHLLFINGTFSLISQLQGHILQSVLYQSRSFTVTNQKHQSRMTHEILLLCISVVYCLVYDVDTLEVALGGSLGLGCTGSVIISSVIHAQSQTQDQPELFWFQPLPCCIQC